MTGIHIAIIILLISVLVYTYWVCTRDTYIVRITKNQVTEFKTSFDLTGLPIITFYQGNKKYHFLVDSGSNISYINKGTDITIQMSEAKDTFIGANGTDIDCQYGLLNLYLNNIKYEYTTAIADLSRAFTELKQQYGVTLTGIIGCDFMNKYKYCIDFKEFIVYARK